MSIIIKFSGPEISSPWGAVLCSCLLRKAWCCHNLFIRPHNAPEIPHSADKEVGFRRDEKEKRKKEKKKKVDRNTKVELEKQALLNGTVEKSERVVAH